MRLINVSIARSVWLFPTDGLNPLGLDSLALLIAVKERYAFQKAPSTPEDITPASGGLEFLNGSFEYEEKKIMLTALKIFGDGVIAETKHNTDASDALLEDVLKYAVDSFGWKFDESMVKRKAYYSELVMDGKLTISGVSDKLQRISNLLSEDRPRNPFSVAGVRFGVDPTVEGDSNIPQFVIDRRAGVSFAEDRYFCQAPFTTEGHLQLLGEIEKVINS